MWQTREKSEMIQKLADIYSKAHTLWWDFFPAWSTNPTNIREATLKLTQKIQQINKNLIKKSVINMDVEEIPFTYFTKNYFFLAQNMYKLMSFWWHMFSTWWEYNTSTMIFLISILSAEPCLPNIGIRYCRIKDLSIV